MHAFPRALAYCLEEAGATLDDVDYVAFYDKPFLKFERPLETDVAFAPWGLRSFQSRCPSESRRNCSKGGATRRAREHRSGRGLVSTPTLRRTPHQPCGIGLLSLAVRRCAGAEP